MIFHELISSGSQGGGELREAVTSSLSQREPSGVLVMPFFFLIGRGVLLYKISLSCTFMVYVPLSIVNTLINKPKEFVTIKPKKPSSFFF